MLSLLLLKIHNKGKAEISGRRCRDGAYIAEVIDQDQLQSYLATCLHL